MYSRNGSQAYAQVGLESSVMSASPHQLIVLLFDGARSALVRARILLQQNDIAGKGYALSKAIDIITNGLKADLDIEKGGELAENLAALYDYMVQRLMIANLHNDAKVIDEVETLLNSISDAWRQIGPTPQAVQSGAA
ncbi:MULTISPECIES: flagellar export chaperone FliS [Symbiopectobacterium]|uniref:flagellar export chaperone FliS n=1 Tax=Symbiopectobacterium TaxID=801 RepID=UPI001A2D673C|nr:MULTISPECIES: flagellar export chaperone FliS [Symbiopectobacterium]MBG6248506.1 flagellar export chaperone FliS [Candidatus Symbiopectobacterium sp. PLON1]MBT9430770.1 flagellar export chaperone FliS [Candidatus Symbiopectobacterium endolongispinus]